jgi:hypothetical protein
MVSLYNKCFTENWEEVDDSIATADLRELAVRIQNEYSNRKLWYQRDVNL